MTPTPPVSTTVSGAPPAQAPPASTTQHTGPAASPQAGGPPAEDVAAIKAKLEELQGQVAEHQRNAQFWYEKANGKGTHAEPEKRAAAAPEDEIDVLDVITTKGVKGLDEIMAKRGYIRKQEAESIVNAKAGQLTREQQLLKDYPELSDKKSEFFQATAGYYGELKKAGVPEEMAMQMAAERADLAFIRSGKRKTPQQQTEDTKAQREQERQARIRAQAGDRGGRTPEGSEEDDELSPEQQRIAVRMLAGEPGPDGTPMTEAQAVEAYKSRAKKGVAIRGGMR